MEESYRFFIEFKAIYPLIFWLTIVTSISLIIIALWKIFKKKQNLNVEHIDNQEAKTISSEKETVEPKYESQEHSNTIEKPQPKTYIEEHIKRSLEVNEPQSTYIKSTNEKPNRKVSAIISEKIKPKSKEQLPESKEEAKISKGEIAFVDYEIIGEERIDSYPIFRFPKKGTVVKSYRIGNTKRRGFKDESFQKSIEQYFGKEFTVLGNVRLNTGKDTRPFEPDIAIIDKSNANLRIDIEIDEPYAGITRQPTHCKGEDTIRDIYFVDRGWIVIRFSEHQVHSEEIGCLRFIANKIKSAIPDYKTPIQLSIPPSLHVEKLWNIVQAQKWEKEKYREHYLNHTFQITEEQPETVERNFNDQEIAEEKLVNPTLIGEIDNKKALGFNLENRHPRDNRIKFYPAPHVYTIDNIPVPSASTIISKFFPEFDAYNAASRLKPTHELYGKDIEEIIDIWVQRGKKAANRGTFLHEQIENYYLEQHYEKTDEFHLFENFINEHKNIRPYRTEWRIFDEYHNIAGTIDLISKNGDKLEIYDWKRSKKVVNPSTREPITYNPCKRGIGKLSDIDDTSYNRYCLQQSLYKYILEKNYGLKVSEMYLIVLYPDYDTYYKVKVPYLKDKVEYLLKAL